MGIFEESRRRQAERQGELEARDREKRERKEKESRLSEPFYAAGIHELLVELKEARGHYYDWQVTKPHLADDEDSVTFRVEWDHRKTITPYRESHKIMRFTTGEDRAIIIQGEDTINLSAGEWETDRRLLEEAIESAYRHPEIYSSGSGGDFYPSYDPESHDYGL